MSATRRTTDAPETNTETETEAELVTDGGSTEPVNPAKALLEDAAGL